ncbi:DUF4019 domain-containing protein [Billgrantia sp. Q4P2]|uniref:DUF4019 domain-containing protein n=1 Tax=Billgrantia sp. Q4P2 TaxID=3463857 RepID=UPI0040562C52
MDYSSTLQVVGQVAGIGGLALGVLLLVFREVIRKNIFPNLDQSQAYRLILLIVVLTFVIATFGIGSWLYVQRQASPAPVEMTFPAQSAEPTILDHLRLVDSNQFLDAWRLMASEAHERMQYDFIAQAYETQRRPLGEVIKRELHAITPLKQLPDQTRGAFLIATYISEFERGGRYLEAVTAIAEDGQWKVLFHQLAPCTPQVCND